MRTWQSINIDLLKYAIREGLLKPFCLFVLMKINFPKHTIFLNYSPNRFAKRFKMHPKTAERYIRRLLAAGFCEMRGDHLLFRNQEKICRDLGIEEKGRLSIQVRPWNRLSQIENRLYYLTLKINAAQQDFRNVVNNGIHNANSLLNKRTLNRAKKMHQQSLLWKGKSEASNDGRRFCSCRQTARLFNLSHTKANQILNKLIRLKYLESEFDVSPFFVFRKNETSLEKKIMQDLFNASLPGFFYCYGRTIYRHRGRVLSFNY